jgi:hypothetical protein
VPGPLKPRKYVVQGCSVQCSLNPRNLPVAGAYDAIHAWYEQGCNAETIQSNAKTMGWELTTRAIFRHKANHLVAKEHLTHFGEKEQVVLDPDAPARKLSDLEILDKIIQAGSKQLAQQSVRITPEMTMKAMELRLKLTQGSVFDDFLNAVGQAFGAETPGDSSTPESPAAVKSADEQQQGEAVAVEPD